MDLDSHIMEVDAPAESIFSNLNVNVIVKQEHDEDQDQLQHHHPSSLNDLLFGSGGGMDNSSMTMNNNFMCTNEVKNEPAGVSPCSSRDENIGPERIFKNDKHIGGDLGGPGGAFESSSSSSGSGEKILDDVSFMPVLSSETVFRMAKSVGVEISKDAAFSLGQLAMERIRNVTHHAMQLCKHERSRALSSDHFTRAAAKIYDYHFLPIDHTIERKKCLVNVNSVVKSKTFNEIHSDVQEPSFNYHFANFHDPLTEQNWRKSFKLSFFKSTDSIIDNIEEDDDDDDKNQTPTKSNKSSKCNKKKSPAKNNSKKKPANNHVLDTKNIQEELSSDSSENEERIESIDQDEYVDKLITKNINKYYSSNDPLQEFLQDFNDNDISNSKDSSQEDICLSNLSPTWVNYYSMFLESFFSIEPTDDKEEEEEKVDKNFLLFQEILKDIEKNGIYPILSIVCKFFLHYLKGDFGEIEEKKVDQILNVFKSLSYCSIKPNQMQVQVISLVLIKILILQPSILHLKSLSRIFCNITVKSGVVKETFTWTNKYITEALKAVSTIPSKELSENQPCLLFSALSLANQIENHGYKQIHKNEEWINLLLKILEEKNNTFDLSTEEAILNFLNILFTKYNGVIPYLKLNTLFNSFSDLCGEKLIPITSQQNDFISIIPLNSIKISKTGQEPYRYPYPMKRNKRVSMNLSARSRRRRIVHQSRSASAANSIPIQEQKDLNLNIPSVIVNNDPEIENNEDTESLMPKPKRIKLQEHLLMDTT